MIGHRLFRRDQQGGRPVADLTGQRCGDPSALGQRRQLRHLLQTAATTRTLVYLDACQWADLGVEPALVDGPDGPLVTLEGEDLHVLAGEVPLLGDHLGTPELGHLLGAVAIHPAGRAAERIFVAERLGGLEGQTDGDHAHVLHAAGHHQVLHAGHDAHRREAHGLLTRTALAIHGGAGDGLG